ncbi:hypothetical protein QYF61_026947 [Mycteria americana]|uniref:Uncharacterized protein n=1 Tax=Mycteria americana TaxID=33587 RepID=A0AAN7NM69_MYCAM|nr:hypothetical protein QYF61_026947 [Mycteria americana]
MERNNTTNTNVTKTDNEGEVFHPSDHFCGPPLDLLQQVHVFPVLRAPELDAVLQVQDLAFGLVEAHEVHTGPLLELVQVPLDGILSLRRVNCTTQLAQDTVGFRGCEGTLLAHVQLFIHQYPQVLLCRAALNPFIPQPVLILGVAHTQVQDLALGPVELMRFTWAHFLSLSRPLHANCTIQLGVVSKLVEGALDPTVYVIDEDIKQYWSQYGPLRDTTCHQYPSEHGAVDHYPLDATIQSIPHPLNSPSIRFISLQFREKDVVGDLVKGLTEVHIDDIHSSSLVH